MLNKSAHQKPSTRKPSTKWAVMSTIKAFITTRNKPKVKSVIGMVSTMMMGFKKALSTARTKATKTAVRKPSTLTPGIKYWAMITAKLETRIFNKNINTA